MIYFDNAATTPVYPEVAEAAAVCMTRNFCNPSALYGQALLARNAVEQARREVASVLGCGADELFFTSGATESINTVFRGVCRNPARARIVTTAGEHAAVRRNAEALRTAGADVAFAPLDASGRVDVPALLSLVTPETTLVSILHVSNETGAVNPVAEIAERVKARAPKAIVHVDGVQGFGKMRVRLVHIDCLSVSAHKIRAPKGVGALYVKKGVRFPPTILGGGQENGMRSGTENVPGIVAFGLAAKRFAAEYDSDRIALLARRAYEGLSVIDGFFTVVPFGEGSPHVLACGVRGVRGETLVHALSERDIVIGTGSACSSHAVGNPVLSALGADKETILSSVRLSFGMQNTPAEVDALVTAVTEACEKLRG